MRHRIDARAQALSRHVIVRPTAFRPPIETNANLRIAFQDLYRDLQSDDTRNALICRDIVAAVKEGRTPLLLTERKSHLEELARRLEPDVEHKIILRGGMSRKELKAALERLSSLSPPVPRVILATGRFIGEGFDDSRLDTLFLALPVSWRGTVAQYAGRLHRLHEGKQEVRVYDYADLNVPMLARMFDRRCNGYESIGYTILLPASAIPGWPPEVMLPVEPEWKRDYANSIQRLIRDGIDVPLANLFLHAARQHAPDAKGIDRARSASEAFLYRRLQTLPETADSFELNAILPIPFGCTGMMEIDLYCAALRLAIELDGPHHFDNKDAYRRDRRKDALLQQQGVFILRFLPEDLAKRLDEVLDTILATVTKRRSMIREDYLLPQIKGTPKRSGSSSIR